MTSHRRQNYRVDGSPTERVSRKYNLLISIDKTKVMANTGIAFAYSFRMNNWSRWILPVPWVPDYRRR